MRVVHVLLLIVKHMYLFNKSLLFMLLLLLLFRSLHLQPNFQEELKMSVTRLSLNQEIETLCQKIKGSRKGAAIKST